jgi:hypothetical protein
MNEFGLTFVWRFADSSYSTFVSKANQERNIWPHLDFFITCFGRFCCSLFSPLRVVFISSANWLLKVTLHSSCRWPRLLLLNTLSSRADPQHTLLRLLHLYRLCRLLILWSLFSSYLLVIPLPNRCRFNSIIIITFSIFNLIKLN